MGGENTKEDVDGWLEESQGCVAWKKMAWTCECSRWRPGERGVQSPRLTRVDQLPAPADPSRAGLPGAGPVVHGRSPHLANGRCETRAACRDARPFTVAPLVADLGWAA